MQFKNEAGVQLNIPVGLDYRKFLLGTFRRSWGGRWLGGWFINLDPASRFARGLLGLLLWRWGSGSFALAGLSPIRSNTGES
jgi:hypothetical protein